MTREEIKAFVREQHGVIATQRDMSTTDSLRALDIIEAQAKELAAKDAKITELSRQIERRVADGWHERAELEELRSLRDFVKGSDAWHDWCLQKDDKP